MTDHPKKPEPVAAWGLKYKPDGLLGGARISREFAIRLDEQAVESGDAVVVPLYEHPPTAEAPKPEPACLALAHQHGALRAILEVVTMDAALLANNMDLDATDLRAELQAIARRCAHVLELLDTCPTNPLAQATCDDYPQETS